MKYLLKIDCFYNGHLGSVQCYIVVSCNYEINVYILKNVFLLSMFNKIIYFMKFSKKDFLLYFEYHANREENITNYIIVAIKIITTKIYRLQFLFL